MPRLLCSACPGDFNAAVASICSGVMVQAYSSARFTCGQSSLRKSSSPESCQSRYTCMMVPICPSAHGLKLFKEDPGGSSVRGSPCCRWGGCCAGIPCGACCALVAERETPAPAHSSRRGCNFRGGSIVIAAAFPAEEVAVSEEEAGGVRNWMLAWLEMASSTCVGNVLAKSARRANWQSPHPDGRIPCAAHNGQRPRHRQNARWCRCRAR